MLYVIHPCGFLISLDISTSLMYLCISPSAPSSSLFTMLFVFRIYESVCFVCSLDCMKNEIVYLSFFVWLVLLSIIIIFECAEEWSKVNTNLIQWRSFQYQLSSHFAAFVLYLLLSSYFLLIYQHPGIFNCFFWESLLMQVLLFFFFCRSDRLFLHIACDRGNMKKLQKD